MKKHIREALSATLPLALIFTLAPSFASAKDSGLSPYKMYSNIF